MAGLHLCNRVPSTSVGALVDHPLAGPTVRAAAGLASAEIDAALTAATALRGYVDAVLGCPLVEIPALAADDPRAVITAAAAVLEPALAGPPAHATIGEGRARGA